MKLFVLTFGAADTPSTHFRIHQYADRFRDAGVEIDHARARGFADFERLSRCDLVLLQKTLLSTSTVRKIRRASRALIYDADDRIWMRPGTPYGWVTRTKLNRRLRTTVLASDLCLAANGVIAGDQRAAGARRVEVLPMSVDTARWFPGEDRENRGDEITIGWSGSPGNLAFLEPLGPALAAIRHRNPQVRVLVHCGERPELDGLELEHIPYVPDREPDAVRRFDIGLLPLPSDPFVDGKSPIKALQYFACGAAVTGQAVGATGELLQHDVNALTVGEGRTWEANLQRMVDDAALRARLVEGGAALVRRAHDMDVVFERYLSLLNSVVETAPC